MRAPLPFCLILLWFCFTFLHFLLNLLESFLNTLVTAGLILQVLLWAYQVWKPWPCWGRMVSVFCSDHAWFHCANAEWRYICFSWEIPFSNFTASDYSLELSLCCCCICITAHKEFWLYWLKRKFLFLLSFIPGDGSKGPLLFQHMLWTTESFQNPSPPPRERTPVFHSYFFLAAHYNIYYEMEKQHGLDWRLIGLFFLILNKHCLFFTCLSLCGPLILYMLV